MNICIRHSSQGLTWEKWSTHFTTLFSRWWYTLTSCGNGLTSTGPLYSCPPTCLWRAQPIRAVENWIWWPSRSALRESPWRTPSTLPPTPQSLWSLCPRFATYQRHIPSGGLPALAQALCNGSIFTQCPIGQLWFRYADGATWDFSSLPLHLWVWTWLWPFPQP